MQVSEAIRSDVKYLKDKFAVRWKEVWSRRAQAKAAIKAENEEWMMEEKLARMQMDEVNVKGCVSQGRKEEYTRLDDY